MEASLALQPPSATHATAATAPKERTLGRVMRRVDEQLEAPLRTLTESERRKAGPVQTVGMPGVAALPHFCAQHPAASARACSPASHAARAPRGARMLRHRPTELKEPVLRLCPLALHASFPPSRTVPKTVRAELPAACGRNHAHCNRCRGRRASSAGAPEPGGRGRDLALAALPRRPAAAGSLVATAKWRPTFRQPAWRLATRSTGSIPRPLSCTICGRVTTWGGGRKA